MNLDVVIDNTTIKVKKFSLLKQLPPELFYKTAEYLEIPDVVSLHDDSPESDGYNAQVYSVTLKNLLIMNDTSCNVSSQLPLPRKFYGDDEILFLLNGCAYVSLDIRNLERLSKHFATYVKGITVNQCSNSLLRGICEQDRNVAGVKIARFLNSLPRLDLLSTNALDATWPERITTPIRELWCSVYDKTIHSMNTEHLEALCFKVPGKSSFETPPRYRSDGIQLSQKLATYSFPNLHTLRFEAALSTGGRWVVDFRYFGNMPNLTNFEALRCKITNLGAAGAGFFYAGDIDLSMPIPFETNVSLMEAEGVCRLLVHLTSLKLNKCGFLFLEELKNFQCLGTLDLLGSCIEDWELLKHLKSLKNLVACNGNSGRIPNMEGLPHLAQLSLGDNKISEITGLDSSESLTDLNLPRNNLREIAGLLSLHNLRALDLSGNIHLRTIGNGLKSCHQLRSLFLLNCDIEKLEGLENLTKLKILCLNGNQIKILENLDGQKRSLQTLQAMKNQISEIRQDFSEFTALEEVALNGNQIDSFKNINKVPALGTLLLSGNKLTRVDQGLDYPQLLYVLVYENMLSDTKGFEKLRDKVRGLYNQVVKD